jgi:S-adenosylmethionine:tRNA ribosyltransferase-isomerase
LKAGAIVDFGAHFAGEIIDEPGTEIRHVKFQCEGSFQEELARVGLTPLPPYIKRNETSNNDRERYQTVYARSSGAIAAPTAGLHFTPEVVAELRSKAHVAEITLHVGYGTFEPVRVAEVSDHAVSSESYEVSREAANTINDAKGGGGKVIAVGTTTVRTLESSTNSSGQLWPQQSESKLTITPGYKFQIVDALLTNFHLPRSSLLLLVSAFAGRDFTLAAYKHAVDQGYRFYSYGDCMLIL